MRRRHRATYWYDPLPSRPPPYFPIRVGSVTYPLALQPPASRGGAPLRIPAGGYFYRSGEACSRTGQPRLRRLSIGQLAPTTSVVRTGGRAER